MDDLLKVMREWLKAVRSGAHECGPMNLRGRRMNIRRSVERKPAYRAFW